MVTTDLPPHRWGKEQLALLARNAAEGLAEHLSRIGPTFCRELQTVGLSSWQFRLQGIYPRLWVIRTLRFNVIHAESNEMRIKDLKDQTNMFLQSYLKKQGLVGVPIQIVIVHKKKEKESNETGKEINRIRRSN